MPSRSRGLTNRDAAQEVLRAFEEVSRHRYVPPYAFALVHAGLDDRGAVFEWLDRAYEARNVHLAFLTVDPKWDPLRGDSRFRSLLERCDFEAKATASD